jgi:L-fuculose-phosphate aldolase
MSDPRKALVEAAQRLHEMGCLPASDGNLSARAEDNLIWISPSGVEKRKLTIDDFIRIDDTGHAVNSGANPSSEWHLHLAIYQHRAEVNSILHAHPPYLTAFAAAHQMPNSALLAEAELAIGEICLVPYAPPGSAALGEQVVACMKKCGIYLLENHGVVAVGSDTTQALHRLERAEFLASVSILAQSIGGALPLTAAQVAELRKRRRE